jgi:hypothetical protein
MFLPRRQRKNNVKRNSSTCAPVRAPTLLKLQPNSQLCSQASLCHKINWPCQQTSPLSHLEFMPKKYSRHAICRITIFLSYQHNNSATRRAMFDRGVKRKEHKCLGTGLIKGNIATKNLKVCKGN